MSIDDIKSTARQFIRLRDEISLLTGRQSELKKRMTASLDELEPDDRGHRALKIEDDVFGEIKITKQRRVSKTLDMDIADKILTEKGIKNTCVKMVPTLDEAAIMSAFYEGYLTEEDIDAMFPAKESYALIVDNK